MTTATIRSSFALEAETEIRFTLDDEGRPVTHLSTQHSLDEQMQELLRVHLYGYRRQFDGMTLTHKFTIESNDPCASVWTEGAYLVVTTTYHP